VTSFVSLVSTFEHFSHDQSATLHTTAAAVDTDLACFAGGVAGAQAAVFLTPLLNLSRRQPFFKGLVPAVAAAAAASLVWSHARAAAAATPHFYGDASIGALIASIGGGDGGGGGGDTNDRGGGGDGGGSGGDLRFPLSLSPREVSFTGLPRRSVACVVNDGVVSGVALGVCALPVFTYLQSQKAVSWSLKCFFCVCLLLPSTRASSAASL
jgi:hypothetical protein